MAEKDGVFSSNKMPSFLFVLGLIGPSSEYLTDRRGSITLLPMNGSFSNQDCLVSVIIVNWNGRSWLETCLPTLAAQTFSSFETIVVDNGSTDGSVAWLGEHWPQVRVIELPENLGFAAANNVAIRQSQAPYVVTLNNDTCVAPTWLAELVVPAQAPNVGMVACQIVQWQHPDRLDSAGIDVDKAGIGWNRGWDQPVELAQEETAVFGPSAAAALYRRDMLADIGLFDEDFFAYYEDVDLAWRAQRAGWRCLYTPKAQARHWHSATANRTPRFKSYLLSRNKLWTLIKNIAWPNGLRYLPAIFFYEVLSLGWQVLQTRSLVPINGRLAALRRGRHIWSKRERERCAAPLCGLTVPWRFGKRPLHVYN